MTRPLPAKGDPPDLAFTFERPAYMHAFRSRVKELGAKDKVMASRTRRSRPPIASGRWRPAVKLKQQDDWRQARSAYRYEGGARPRKNLTRLHPRLQVVCEPYGRPLVDIVPQQPHPVGLRLLDATGKERSSSTASPGVVLSVRRV